MADYFNSTYVTAFPTTYRIYNAGGKYTSELNITNMLKSFIQNKSFVIDKSDSILKVVINGYYFEISYSAFDQGNVPAYLYLGIRVENGYLVSNVDGSVNLDVGSEFTGLKYRINSAPTGCSHTLQVTGENGELVNTSFIPSIADPSTGNWYDFSKLIKLIIIGDDDNAYIDPRFIRQGIAVTFNDFTVGAAKRLVNDNGSNVNLGRKGIEQIYVYFSGGKPVAGNRTTIANRIPTSTDSGSQGDLWFVLKG